jgi:serine protease Do
VKALCLFVLLLTGAPDGEGDALDELEALQTTMRAALETISPCVVTIDTVGGIRRIDVPDELKEKMTLPERPREDAPERGRDGEEKEGEPAPEGRTPRFKDEWRKMLRWRGFQKAEGPTTGVIISADGYVVTSAWNFDSKPNVVTVTTADGVTHAAKLLGVDRAAGLALLKMDAAGLRTPVFLSPSDARVGAWAFAVGRAIARQATTIKYGVISAKNRIEGNALQTDAATSPTNYGGPLIDIEGRVYGIIVPLGANGEESNPNWYDSGIGFCAPIADPARFVERMSKEGTELLPAYLGVQMDDDRTEPGVLVVKVDPESSAHRAGLAKDDVITSINGIPVKNAFTLRFEIGRCRAGDTATLVIERGKETMTLEAKLAVRPQRPDDEKIPVPLPGPKDDGDGKE